MLEKLYATVQQATFRAVETLQLPEYKGSTIRGAFGHVFRRVSCPILCRNQATCILRYRCAYSVCFETPIPEHAAIMRKYPFAPHPFVLEPPADPRTRYEPGEEFSIRLILIGRGNDYLAHFVYALDELGGQGFGQRRGKAELVSLGAGTEEGTVELFDREERRLRGEAPAIRQGHIDRRAAELRGVPLRVRFETPTRVKSDGQFTNSADLGILFPGLLRRLSTLHYFHCNGGENFDNVRELVAMARSVQTLTSNVQWLDWTRYSQRQDTTMQLGGFVGEAEYGPVPDPLLPVLAWGELLHIGKASAFGLGKFSIEAIG